MYIMRYMYNSNIVRVCFGLLNVAQQYTLYMYVTMCTCMVHDYMFVYMYMYGLHVVIEDYIVYYAINYNTE